MVATQDPNAPLVVIVGITGNQGGSVANHLCDSAKPYRIVGLTRDATKPSAQAFTQKDVELREVNIVPENGAAVVKAFEGADIVFAVTKAGELGSREREAAQGKLMVNAAKTTGVKLFVWSGNEPIAKISGGRYSCAPFDAKADITEYLKASGVPYSVVPAGGYLSNLFGGPNAPTKQDDGTYLLSMPVPASVKTPMLDTALDYGRYVCAAIENPALGPRSEVLTGLEISFEDQLAHLSECKTRVTDTGKTFRFRQLSQDEWNTRWGPIVGERLADMVYNMWKYVGDYGYYGGKDLATNQKAAGVVPVSYSEMLGNYKPERFAP